MKKILSLILVAAMLMSLVVMTAGAEETDVIDSVDTSEIVDVEEPSDSEESEEIDSNLPVDEQGIYYTLDDETLTAIVGKNTYADSASAGELKTDIIVIPETVTFGEKDYTVVAIGRNAFDGTAIREIVIADSVETIGEFAFAGCTKLEKVWAPNTAEIKGFAFWGCTALNEVYVFSAQTIGGGAFWNCSNLRNITLIADTIMEKAFEGCDKLEYIVFGNEVAPAVAEGALGTVKKAYISAEATGFEEFPVETEVLTSNIIDIEDTYAKAGETVALSVVAPVGAVSGDISIRINFAEGFTIASNICGADNQCLAENVVYDVSTLTGVVTLTTPGVIAILNVTLPENAAGSYEITAEAEGYTCIAGSITVCDHADTKTVTVKAASCTEAGMADIVCTACGEVISSEEIAAKDHSYKDFVINPTCTEGGYTRHICDVCVDTYTDAETEALGHTFESKVNIVPTASKKGQITHTCTSCGTVEKEELPKVIYGDANSDGEVTIIDATAMLQYIAGWDMSETSFYIYSADVVIDGTLTLDDVTLLLQKIAGWDVKLGIKR